MAQPGMQSLMGQQATQGFGLGAGLTMQQPMGQTTPSPTSPFSAYTAQLGQQPYQTAQPMGSVAPPTNVGPPPSPTQGTPATQGTPNAAPAAGANAQPQQQKPSGGGLF